MAGKLPTDLTDAGWQKIKEMTVGKTGFGAKLDAYQKAKAKLSVSATRNFAAYNAAAEALADITKAIPAAQGKCNKTLHKNTIAALAAYKGLVDKEGHTILAEQQKYHGYLDDWIHRREVSKKELTVIEKSMVDEEKDALAAVNDLIKQGKIKEAGEAAKAEIAKFKVMQQQADKSCESWRVPKTGAEQPHVDDRPDTLFGPLIKLVNDIIATRTNAERHLIEAVQKAVQQK